MEFKKIDPYHYESKKGYRIVIGQLNKDRFIVWKNNKQNKKNKWEMVYDCIGLDNAISFCKTDHWLQSDKTDTASNDQIETQTKAQE